MEWGAKSKEAELNARLLSLESQIHWLNERNAQLDTALQQQAQQQPAGDEGVEAAGQAGVGGVVSELQGRCTALEGELRKAKRAEGTAVQVSGWVDVCGWVVGWVDTPVACASEHTHVLGVRIAHCTSHAGMRLCSGFAVSQGKTYK